MNFNDLHVGMIVEADEILTDELKQDGLRGPGPYKATVWKLEEGRYWLTWHGNEDHYSSRVSLIMNGYYLRHLRPAPDPIDVLIQAVSP